MPGPAPKAANERRRRNAVPDLLKLPSEGWAGDKPKWPLVISEPPVWGELWQTPQAAAWHKLGWTWAVARYAQILGMCEDMDAKITAFSEARQMEDKLGLNPMAMKRLGWEIAGDEVAEKRDSKPAPNKRRLKIVAEEFTQIKAAE